MPRPAGALTVKELTRIVKELLEGTLEIQGIWVRGEISNFKRHTSGHLYFTLKDDAAQVRCVMFKTRAFRLKFGPEDGMAVLVYGSVGVYERDGAYQLYVDDMQPDGIGSLYKAFVQLKSRLEAEGLFDVAKKRRLPVLPQRIGVVTSLKGAAVRDIINIAQRRWPGVSLVLSDVLVQGDGAPVDIIRGLSLVTRVPGVEAVIVGRGGGSIEELWAFNSEALARAIRACPVPVVSAVGHETDFTIADFAADVRAPTPSAAAEIVVPDVRRICDEMSVRRSRMTQAIKRMLGERKYAVAALSSRPVLRRGIDLVLQRRQHIDDMRYALVRYAGHLTDLRNSQVQALAGKLEALSPLGILSRGYAICSRPDGSVLRDATQVAAGERVGVRLSRGMIDCTVTGTHDTNSSGGGPGGRSKGSEV
jgi:exodeoxyribonuclease VII large subunit